MPKITPYEQETQGSGPVTGLDSNLAQVQDLGQGLKNFGSDVGTMLDQNMRRQEQTETADAYSATADARTSFTEDIQQQEADGTLSADKVGQAVDDWAETQQDNYSTPQSKDYFARQAARLKASMIKSATMGQARVAYNNGKVTYEQDLNNSVSTVTADPTQHDDILADNLTHIDEQVKNGTIPAAQAPLIRQNVTQQIAMAAIRSTANKDPGLAQKMLDEKDDNNLSKVLTPQQQNEMQAVVKQSQTAKSVDQERQIELQKKIRDANDQQVMDTHYNDIVSGKMSASQIQNLNLSWQKKNEAINIAKASANADMSTTNPQAFNNIAKQIATGTINEPGQIYKYVGNQDPMQRISPTDAGKLRTLIDQSPEGQAVASSRKALLKVAQDSLVASNAFMGSKDPNGELNLMTFTKDLTTQEEQMRQQGKPVADLYNPKSPDFFGNQINQYKVTPQQKLEQAAKQKLDAAASDPNATVDVINPKGEPVRIRKSQLADALKAKYRLK